MLRRLLEPIQYTSIRFGESLQLAGMTPSIGSVGDAYGNALAETTIGLYKTECTRDGSPFRTGPLTRLGDVEQATSAWVHWYNTSRLMHPSADDHLPNTKPTTMHEPATTDRSFTHNRGCIKPGTIHKVQIAVPSQGRDEIQALWASFAFDYTARQSLEARR